MLPVVILQNEVTVALATQLVLNVLRNVWHCINTELDALPLLNKPQKVRVPVGHVDADFVEIFRRN
jgi:hypothetical protein